MGNVHMEATQINYREGDKKMSVAQAIKNAGNTGLAHTADIAPEFSTESAYNAGDFVYHNGILYEFTANHAAGAWSTADTQAATVGGKIASLEGDVANLSSVKANQITIAPTFSAETAYDPGDIVYYNGLSYRCVNEHQGEWDADDFAATTISNELTSLMSGLTGKRGVSAYNETVILAEFDGISSYGAYLNTAYNALQTYINNLASGVLIHIDRMNIDNIAINNPSSRIGDNTNTVGGLLFAQFIAFDVANGHLVVRKVDAIGKTYEMIDDGVYSDLTSNVPVAGGTISVNVTLYATLS